MKPLLMVLALAAGLAIACGSDSANDNPAASIGSTGSVGAASAGSTGAAGLTPGGPDDATANSARGASAARLVLTSQISLEVTGLRAAYQQTGEIARGLGGFVAEARFSSARVSASEQVVPARDDETSAFLRIRVPSEQHDALLGGLREAGSVRSEETATREVTGEYTDLQSRVVNLQRSETQYQELMTRAGSIEDILIVAARLDDVRAEIEQVQGRINLLGDQSDFATVSVTLALPAVAVAASPDTAGGLPSPMSVFVDALEGSVSVAHALANVAAVLTVVVLWILPLSAAFLILRRPIQRLITASKARLS